MTEGLFCSFFTEERMDMKNNITVQIGSGYGDLRKSEKQAADYILNHMEEAAELPLDRLAEAAKVSQPTVLRMLKAVGYEGYRDFRYQLVAELAKTGGAVHGRESDLMYGYTLDRKEGLDAVPLNITVTTERMLEETLKNLPLKTYRKAIDALRSARILTARTRDRSSRPSFTRRNVILHFPRCMNTSRTGGMPSIRAR